MTLGHQHPVEAADKKAQSQAENQHDPYVLRGVQYINAEARDDGDLRADGDIDLACADDHGHAQGDDACGGRGLREYIGNVAPAEKVGINSYGDDDDQ